ncbi:MAG: sugar ABC transporter ATP-binding protein [Vicinamibacterales bacterium]
MGKPVLQLRDIQKRFLGVHALKGVSLDVHPGEVVALLGENGAGKSTLMKIAGGIEQPDSGEILLDGTPVVVRDVHTASSHGIAFIHQELNLLDNLDVAGNVLLGREPTTWGRLRLVDRRQMHALVQPYLAQLGLSISAGTAVAGLSIAQQQLVEIAKALSLKARVLIMDEPTSSLTLSETSTLHEIVAALRADGVGVVYISHRLGEVRAVADRAVVLRDGANVGSLTHDELTHDNMVRLMVGRDIAPHVHSSTVAQGEYFRIEGLRTRRYPRETVSFGVSRGEILGIAGLVGAGRSEVAQAIFGVERPLAGRVLLDGSAIEITDPAAAIRQGVFLVPEDRRTAGLVVDFSVRENVTLPALQRYASHGLVSTAKERIGATAVCNQLRVKTPSIEIRTANLSGGNQQKVVLAKWLALGPKVLIVDEPTRGIDVGANAEIYTLLRDLARSGGAIVMISSDMEEILNMSDRVAVMHEGAITGTLPRAACSEEEIMTLAVG